MRIYKNLLLFGAVFLFLSGCSNDDAVSIEEPTDGARQIEINNSTIASYESHLAEEQKKYDEAETDGLKEAYAETIQFWERSISGLENDNEILKDTLIYNDEFKTVQGVGVYTQIGEGVLTKQLSVSSFSGDGIEVLEKYRHVITDGAILINALPFKDGGDKYAVIAVYYSQEKLDSIDFEKASEDDSGLFLYENADYVKAHTDLSEFLEDSGDFDKVPDMFIEYSAGVY